MSKVSNTNKNIKGSKGSNKLFDNDDIFAGCYNNPHDDYDDDKETIAKTTSNSSNPSNPSKLKGENSKLTAKQKLALANKSTLEIQKEREERIKLKKAEQEQKELEEYNSKKNLKKIASKTSDIGRIEREKAEAEREKAEAEKLAEDNRLAEIERLRILNENLSWDEQND
jgi:hypothetical protein